MASSLNVQLVVRITKLLSVKTLFGRGLIRLFSSAGRGGMNDSTSLVTVSLNRTSEHARDLNECKSV